MPRYNLLLKELLKKTEKTHPDYKNIDKAMKKIDNIVKSIDVKIKEYKENR